MGARASDCDLCRRPPDLHSWRLVCLYARSLEGWRLEPWSLEAGWIFKDPSSFAQVSIVSNGFHGFGDTVFENLSKH